LQYSFSFPPVANIDQTKRGKEKDIEPEYDANDPQNNLHVFALLRAGFASQSYFHAKCNTAKGKK
jgi:hypothetical protein